MIIIPWFINSIVKIGRNGVVRIIYGIISISPIISWYKIIEIIIIEGIIENIITWNYNFIEYNFINLLLININIKLGISICILLIIILLTTVSYIIHIYIIWYGWTDPYKNKLSTNIIILLL